MNNFNFHIDVNAFLDSLRYMGIGMIGIFGAVECGSLGIGAGFLLGMLLVAVEYLCLRTQRRKA